MWRASSRHRCVGSLHCLKAFYNLAQMGQSGGGGYSCLCAELRHSRLHHDLLAGGGAYICTERQDHAGVWLRRWKCDLATYIAERMASRLSRDDST